ncbi:MAG TPA: ATP-binding protein [Nitrospiria bacterium]|nr:ATP-binding protein [Nitrospiria bacterium]
MDRTTVLHHVFAQLRSGIVAVDRGKRVVLMNAAAGAILGLDPANAEGRPIDEALTAHPNLVGFLADALNLNTVLDRAEMSIGGPHCRTLGVTSTPLPAATGHEGGLVVIFKDLTQVERQEEQAQLKERLMALGQMAAGLAHEMRNPLAGIKVAVGLLRKTLKADPEVDQKLHSIMGDVNRLNQSVTDCLAFARPIRLEPKYVQINDVLEKVLGQTVSLEYTYPFQVARQFGADLPKTWVDPQQLEIVFFNLINNAIDAVRQRHGTITISTAARRDADTGQDSLVTTIEDNGEGIPRDRLPKVFMPFFTTKGKGSGLGLANAKKIVDHLRGTIELSSEPGRGTCFAVHLPVLTTPEQGARAA